MYKNAAFTSRTSTYNHSAVAYAQKNHISYSCTETLMLIFVAQATGKYTFEGVSGALRAGTVFLLSPFEYYKLTPQLNTPYDVYKVSFTRMDLALEVLDRLDLLLSADAGRRIFIGQSVVVHSLFERMESAASLSADSRELYVKILLSEIVMLLSFSNSSDTARDKGELGERVIKYLNDNIDRDLSLDYIAERFFVSKYHLCRAFKKHNGISVHGYISKKRILYAKSLIEGGESAADAAYKVGFGDYSAFYRAYVKQLGCAPTANSQGKRGDR